MKKIIIIFMLVVFFVPSLFAQRIIINENFETAGFNVDSLPTNWVKESVDPFYGPGREWAVRDSGTGYVGTSAVVKAYAHDGKRSITIPWSSGGTSGIADDWVYTDTFTVKTGDTLSFWMLLGSISGITPYIDTMQIWAMFGQNSFLTIQKIATIKSNDSAGVPLNNNEWTKHTFDLSAFAGQQICIAFRYYMDVSTNGLWCNIDDVFLGNRSSVGISQIGANVPKSFALHQNYPNPFNPVTKIKFDIAKATNVKIEVFNSLGQAVNTLFNEFKPAGYYETDFNASKLSSGVYFYRLTTDQFVDMKKMVVVK
jgi:hypothetical protein